MSRFYEKDYIAAIDACEKSLAFDSKYAESWNLLGKIRYNQGDITNALKAFEKAILYDPCLAVAWKNLALVHFDKKDYAKTIEDCEKAISIDPALTQAWLLLGFAHDGEKDVDKAIKSFLKAVECNPKLIQAWNCLGIDYAKKKMYRNALDSFQKVIDLEPENIDAWHNLTLMKKSLGDTIGAREAQEKEEYLVKKQKKSKKQTQPLRDQVAEQAGRQAIVTQLLETVPKTAEEAMNLLQKQQREIDRLLAGESFSTALPLIEVKNKIYQIAIDLFQEIGITTLIPTLESEKKKNLEVLYEVNHNVWAERYNALSLEITTLQDQKHYAESMERINQILGMIQERKKESEKQHHQEDMEKLSKLAADFENLAKTNTVVIRYATMEENYNNIVQKIEQKQLTDAIRQIPIMMNELEQLRTSILPELGRNQTLATVLIPVENLLTQAARLKTRVEAEFAAILKGASKETPALVSRVTADIRLPEITKIALSSVKTPLYAKVVLLGESSVGKTHLVLTATGQDYSPMQGSTVGVDKYFKPVKIDLSGYDSQLCFWDLGGQWNFRSINELFLNEAAAILLVYDVTRPETFQSLQYWVDMVKHSRSPSKEQLFIIGNKLDVGGNAVPEKELSEFLARNALLRIYYTSAKNGEGISRLMEDLAGSIDWSALIKNIDPGVIVAVGNALRELRANNKVMRITDLMNQLATLTVFNNNANPLVLKAIIRKYATQELIQFGRSEVFIVLDPEFLGKWVAKLLSNAARADGVVTREEYLKTEVINPTHLDIFFQYLENENICYPLSPGAWVFPNVLHKGEPNLEGYVKMILESAPQTKGYQIKGPGDLIFSRLTVTLARECGLPAFASNVAGLWIQGEGSNKTAALIQFIPARDGGVIRIKAGGGRGIEFLAQFEEIVHHVFAAYTSEVISL